MITLHFLHQPECVHAENSHGDYDTLCAFDPESMQPPVRHKRRKLVTCTDCRAIIRASRAYRVASESVNPRYCGDDP